MEVLCRQRWWQRRSFWQFECSRTIMLKEWPQCFYNLFRVWNVSHGSHLHVLSVRFFLGSTSVLAALPHLQNVVNLGQSVQFPLFRFFLHFQVIVCVPCIQVRVSACQNPAIGSSKLPYTDFFAKGVACGYWLPTANNISAKGKTGLQSDTMWYHREDVVCHIGKISFTFSSFPPVDATSRICPVIKMYC